MVPWSVLSIPARASDPESVWSIVKLNSYFSGKDKQSQQNISRYRFLKLRIRKIDLSHHQ